MAAGVRADTEEGEQTRGVQGDEGDDELVKAVDLIGEELGSSCQLAQGDPGGVADDLTGTGTQRRQLGDQADGGMLDETGPDVVWASNHKGSGLVDRLGALASGAALGDHQGTDRFHGAVPALGGSSCPARQGSSGCAHRVEGIGLAGSATFLTIGAVDLDHLDTSGGEMASQAGSIATRPLHTNQHDGPETAQPREQSTISARVGRELLDAEQTSDGIECSGDVHVGMGVHTAGHGASLYDGQGHPFL